jgi:hypothetical protein
MTTVSSAGQPGDGPRPPLLGGHRAGNQPGYRRWFMPTVSLAIPARGYLFTGPAFISARPCRSSLRSRRLGHVGPALRAAPRSSTPSVGPVVVRCPTSQPAPAPPGRPHPRPCRRLAPPCPARTGGRWPLRRVPATGRDRGSRGCAGRPPGRSPPTRRGPCRPARYRPRRPAPPSWRRRGPRHPSPHDPVVAAVGYPDRDLRPHTGPDPDLRPGRPTGGEAVGTSGAPGRTGLALAAARLSGARSGLTSHVTSHGPDIGLEAAGRAVR